MRRGRLVESVQLVEPVTFELRLDTAGVLDMALKAAAARGGKAKRGVARVQGPKPKPRWTVVREDNEGGGDGTGTQ